MTAIQATVQSALNAPTRSGGSKRCTNFEWWIGKRITRFQSNEHDAAGTPFSCEKLYVVENQPDEHDDNKCDDHVGQDPPHSAHVVPAA